MSMSSSANHFEYARHAGPVERFGGFAGIADDFDQFGAVHGRHRAHFLDLRFK